MDPVEERRRKEGSIGELLNLLGYETVEMGTERLYTPLVDDLFSRGLRSYMTLVLFADNARRAVFIGPESRSSVLRQLNLGCVSALFGKNERFILWSVTQKGGHYVVRLGKGSAPETRAVEMTIPAIRKYRPRSIFPR